jgi:hypothetical protein
VDIGQLSSMVNNAGSIPGPTESHSLIVLA